jgi:protein subunit release factor B
MCECEGRFFCVFSALSFGSAKNDFASRNEAIRMKKLRDADIEEMFSRSSGPGGQHVNKVSTAVTLRHVPTGLSVTVSDSRSQAMNRETARRRLLQKINEAAEAKKLAQLAEASRERRRKAKRSRGTKAKLVESKRRRSETKKLRGKVD